MKHLRTRLAVLLMLALPTLDVHVVDEGPGMTADDLSHVFEPFFSTTTRVQGTGLGLPIVEEIVRAHRGEVAMRSIPGRGTEVILRLPLAAADDTRDDAVSEDTGGTR